MTRKSTRRNFLKAGGFAALSVVSIGIPYMKDGGKVDVEAKVMQQEQHPVKIDPESVSARLYSGSLTLNYDLHNTASSGASLPAIEARVYGDSGLLGTNRDPATGGINGGGYLNSGIDTNVTDEKIDQIHHVELEVLGE